MHKEAKSFLELVKRKFPVYFSDVNVLDCGSLDINGNNRYLFTNSKYTGIDIVEGKNVDVVTKVHEFLLGVTGVYDVIISSEMLEHDKHYVESLKTMFRLLKPDGLLIITAAGEGRAEHGTTKSNPVDSPLTNDYYKNITIPMLCEGLDMKAFKAYPETHINKKIGDIYFVGIKK